MNDTQVYQYDFIAFMETLLLCKEFKLERINTQKIQINRDTSSNLTNTNDLRNLHLYIHQPGMFFLPEFGRKYKSKQFAPRKEEINNAATETKRRANLQFQLYDLDLNPYIPCSYTIYDECIMEEIVKEMNISLGCTYPIQR